MIVHRRCIRCYAFFEVDESKDKNVLCPACRKLIGGAKQKRIQKAVKKKRKKAAK